MGATRQPIPGLTSRPARNLGKTHHSQSYVLLDSADDTLSVMVPLNMTGPDHRDHEALGSVEEVAELLGDRPLNVGPYLFRNLFFVIWVMNWAARTQI